MSISHDQYSKFTDGKVLDETLAFHAKGNYTLHKSTQHLSTLHHIPSKALNMLTGKELKLNTLTQEAADPKFRLTGLPLTHPLARNDSCDHFGESHLHFDAIRQLLAPLLRKNESGYKRGYPSAGAIFPIEIFCINLNNKIEQWPTDCMALHLLPASQTFEIHSADININRLTEAVTPLNTEIGTPALALIYVIYLPKALFKYRYRGYRHALMEVGSLYMLTDLRCKEINLNSRPWSAFTDHQITKLLNLNPALFLPTCIQLIG
ncbi:SagB/ThcOx family dehydrogenase [Pseudomonas vlassakiae]|uniref:SagB/ThcOx family dehydrogenase n=1 Tax=Pseudomonas TaxID=286 RepID=UPI0006D40EB0|nr:MULTISPECIES: SagB/ThcOx family dehydrogenase [Pseudomonas]MCU0126569.1 SagB/ThcOx family dehydrogenase [Pseudomonas vlassakiae]